MTVHLAMRSKCSCNSTITNNNGLKSNLINNYINGNSFTQRNVSIVLLDSKYLDFSYDVSIFRRISARLKLFNYFFLE